MPQLYTSLHKHKEVRKVISVMRKNEVIALHNLGIELKEKAETNQLSTFKKRFCSYDLVILDELGYITFDKAMSELLFNLLCTRNQNKSLIITTNLSFNRWSEIFGDEILTAAMVDRLVHCSHVINIQGQSYRLKETEEWLKNK